MLTSTAHILSTKPLLTQLWWDKVAENHCSTQRSNKRRTWRPLTSDLRPVRPQGVEGDWSSHRLVQRVSHQRSGQLLRAKREHHGLGFQLFTRSNIPGLQVECHKLYMLAVIPLFSIRQPRHSTILSQILPWTPSFQPIFSPAHSYTHPAAHKQRVPPVQGPLLVTHTAPTHSTRTQQLGGPGRSCALSTQVHTCPTAHRATSSRQCRPVQQDILTIRWIWEQVKGYYGVSVQKPARGADALSQTPGSHTYKTPSTKVTPILTPALNQSIQNFSKIM